jgi:uncharacterized protein (TIGR04255 family)
MPDPFSQICYRKNFLEEVIARVDFLSPLQGVETSLPQRLTEIALNGFPIPDPQDAYESQVEMGPQGVSTKRETKFKSWQFHGKDRTKILVIQPGSVVVQHKAYENYEVVKAEFATILDRVSELFPDVQSSRVGLRYVNVIKLAEQDPTNWSAYIAPQLLSLFAFPPEADRPALSRVFHNVELAFDTFNLTCRLGMHNPDYPARIRQKVFVLDLDAYSQTVVHTREVGSLLDDFHSAIQRYFEHSITDKLRSIMNAS